ncbi:MAG: WD40 repeat domain-containing protein [Chloroflexaceae bacterium]
MAVGAKNLSPLPEPEPEIDAIVAATFLGEQSEKDHNLQFVADMLTERAPDAGAVLKTYRAIRRGRNVSDDEGSLTTNHLKLAGIVRREGGLLRVRNPIYAEVFDQRWVRKNVPVIWSQRARRMAVGAIITLVVILAVLAPFTGYFWWQAEQARLENETLALAFRAQTISRDPELGLLLAIEAAEHLPNNPFVETALARMIDASRVRRRFTGHTDWVRSAAYSPDGARIVSASWDGTVRVWPGNFAGLLELAKRRVTRELTPQERAQYLGEPLPPPTPTPTPTPPPAE